MVDKHFSDMCKLHLIYSSSPFVFIDIFVNFCWKFAQLRARATTREKPKLHADSVTYSRYKLSVLRKLSDLPKFSVNCTALEQFQTVMIFLPAEFHTDIVWTGFNKDWNHTLR